MLFNERKETAAEYVVTCIRVQIKKLLITINLYIPARRQESGELYIYKFACLPY